MAKVLKVVLTSGTGSDAPERTINITHPKDSLTLTDVQGVFDPAVSARAFLIGENIANTLKEAYYEETIKTVLS